MDRDSRSSSAISAEPWRNPREGFARVRGPRFRVQGLGIGVRGPRPYVRSQGSMGCQGLEGISDKRL